MDSATVIGLVGAFGVVLGAILLGGSVGIFLNVPSLVIVLGGTLMVVLIKFNLDQFIGAMGVAKNALSNRLQSPQALIPEIVEMASIARKEGVLALEEMETENDFLKTGMDMLIDGSSVEEIDRLLSKDLEETANRHKLGALVFTSAADVAPAMGMVGTLIGLVQMLSAMDDPKSIGPAMAVALLTTLYGAILANMLFQPIADKLALRRGEEIKLNSICLDGILGIQGGQHPRVLESLLKLYINPKERDLKAEDGDKPAEEVQGETVAA